MNAAMNTDFTVATLARPDAAPAAADTGVEDLAEYRERRRLSARRRSRRDSSSEVEPAGLLGRGGAAFPLAVKLTHGPRRAGAGRRHRHRRQWRGGRARVGQGPLAAAQPAASVLDGLRLAAQVVGARHAHVYVSDAAVRARHRDRAGRAGRRDPRRPHGQRPHWWTRLRRRRGDRRGAGHQRRPGQTDRQAAAAVRTGRRRAAHAGQQCRDAGEPALRASARVGQPTAQVGTAASAGTFLATITGGGRAAGLYEFPHGVSCTELLALHRIPAEKVRGALMGGYFAGLLNREVLDTTPGPRDAAGHLGSGLGCGAVSVTHRRVPGRGRGLGAVLLRPRERRAVRVLLQRDRGDGRGRRSAARRGRQPPMTSRGCSAGRWCCGAAVRAPRWTRPPISPPACWTSSRLKWHGTSTTAVMIAVQALFTALRHFSAQRPVRSGGAAVTDRSWHQTNEDQARSHPVRRLRYLRQARARITSPSTTGATPH